MMAEHSLVLVVAVAVSFVVRELALAITASGIQARACLAICGTRCVRSSESMHMVGLRLQVAS